MTPKSSLKKLKTMFSDYGFGQIALVGLTIMLTNSFLTPMFAGSELMSLLQYFLQAWIVLKVDEMVA